MANKQRKIVNLLVTIGGIQYVLGILRFNAGEFSYFFSYPSDSPKEHLNCCTSEDTSRLHHLTWHNGQINLKREDNVAAEIVHFPGPLLPTSPTLTPLYVESFYFKNVPSLLDIKEFTPWSGSVSQEILSLDKSEGFSVIFLLAPSKDTTPNILRGLQLVDIPEGLSCAPSLADLCNLKHRPGRITVWKNWDFVVVVTPFVQNTLSPIPSEVGPCRLPNYLNIQSALTDLMLQANGHLTPKRS